MDTFILRIGNTTFENLGTPHTDMSMFKCLALPER